MASLAELRISEQLRILCYGRFKTGKTAGAATFPRTRFIEVDPNGADTLINPQLEAKYGFSKNVVDVFIPPPDKRSARGVTVEHLAFDACCRYFDDSMAAEKRDSFDTWVLDSGTSLSEVARNKGIILLGGKDFGPKPMSLTQSNAMKTGLQLPRLQDFGAERSLVEQFVDMLLDSGKHVILIAHEKEEWEGEGENQRLVGIVPMFTGQSVEKIPLKFSEVYNLRLEKDGPNWKRTLQTQPDGLRACGSRRGLPNGTEWTFEAIATALKLNPKNKPQ